MAESSWPSPDTSRVVNDFQYERLALSSGPVAGLYGSPADTALIYGDSTGMQIKVRADRYGLVRGNQWWSGGTDFTKTISANASGSTRIDLIVLRLSRTTWNTTVAVVNGTPGAGVAPSPTQNTGSTGVWELPLAAVTVANAAATITAGNVNFFGPYLANDGRGYLAVNSAALTYIPSPYNLMEVPVANDGRWRYNGTIWRKTELWVVKQADEAKTSVTTPADDSALTLTVPPNTNYRFAAELGTLASDSVDGQLRWVFPSGRLDWGQINITTAATGGVPTSTVDLNWRADASSPSTSLLWGGTNSPFYQPVRCRGVLAVGGTGGTFKLQWAQVLSSGLSSWILRGSEVRLTLLDN